MKFRASKIAGKEGPIFDFMWSAIARLVNLRKYRTSETYTTSLNGFMRFRGGEDVLLFDVSSDVMEDYEAYLKTGQQLQIKWEQCMQ